MNGYRARLKELLSGADTARPAAVRRDRTGRALLATDLPTLLRDEDRRVMLACLEQAGWVVTESDGWWLLDRRPSPDDMPEAGGCAEADRCLRLLRLHMTGEAAPADMLRDLWKAADAGTERLDALLRMWHGGFAASLREHIPLPDGLIPYLIPYSIHPAPGADENRKLQTEGEEKE